ncbi:hypothetical protein PBI_LAMBO_33 [Gordonia phage Lambo]|uniref:Glycine-rich domain-containing protein n=1 Tax=Gordonia phage Lambo TaxID=2599845 RepID=A0A5J6TS00_9CAUD|nr:minor tail protein [Gordonia phage Lambo]QFG13543.1 hypothetical protein PBI_LAMBO_33 [Gordonia phage Lambo]
MSGWSPEGPPVESGGALWSSGDGPPTIAWGSFWGNVPVLAGVGSALAQDKADLKYKANVLSSAQADDELYVGLDPMQDFEVRIKPRENAGGNDGLGVSLDALVRDSGWADDLARLGLKGRDNGAGSDFALSKAIIPGRDGGLADELSSVNLATSIGDAGGAGDMADGVFTPRSPLATQYTTVGTFNYPIPVWCRAIEVVCLGGGSGGNGGGTFAGDGGKASTWSWGTFVRGVHIPWNVINLTVVVGAGGNGGGAFGGTGGNGSPSYVQRSGSDILRSHGAIAVGGTGINRTGDAVSPSTLTLGGVTYTGGPESTTDTASVPGSGGRGGAVAAVGKAGGRGQVWLRAIQ